MAEDKKSLPIAKIITGVIIASILIVYALPRLMNWSEGSPIDTEASKLFNNIRVAKTTALKTKHKVWVRFVGNSTYTVYEDTNGNSKPDRGEPFRSIELNPAVRFGVNQQPEMQNVWGTGPATEGVEITNGGNKIAIDPKGQISSNGAIYLIPKADLGTRNDNMRAIKFLSVSGEVYLVRHDAGSSPPWK